MIVTSRSEHHKTTQAAQEIAKDAKGRLNGSPGWAIAFCAGKHDDETFFQALRAELGGIPILGGAAIGITTNEKNGYTGFECGLALFDKAKGLPQIFKVNELDLGEVAAGKLLGSQIKGKAPGQALLFYDSLRTPPPPAPMLNAGSLLLEGLYQGLAGEQLEIIGAGTIADYQFSKCSVFTGDAVERQVAVIALLPANYKVESKVLHGCEPLSSFLEITKVEGPLLHEIDGRPALDVVLETLGQEKNETNIKNLGMVVTLGQKLGDQFSLDEQNYVNRLIVTAIPQTGSLVLFEADFQVGAKIQLMSRSNDMMLESLTEGATEMLEDHPTANFAFYINCAGRSAAFSGSEEEDADLLRGVIGQKMPLLGFYSGVEIAPMQNRSRPLDWTGVLTLWKIN